MHCPGTGWRRPVGRLISVGHFLQKSHKSSGCECHKISGFFAENDLQLEASYGSLPPCTRYAAFITEFPSYWDAVFWVNSSSEFFLCVGRRTKLTNWVWFVCWGTLTKLTPNMQHLSPRFRSDWDMVFEVIYWTWFCFVCWAIHTNTKYAEPVS